MDMISLSHINKSYGEHSVLRDVSLTVRQRDLRPGRKERRRKNHHIQNHPGADGI